MSMKTTALIAAMIAGVALPAVAEDRRSGPAEFFAALDTDGDGKVSIAELEAAKASRFAEMDADGDGFISAEELVQGQQMRRAERMLKRLDKDGDGLLSAEELQPKAPDLSDLDKDGDGFISEEEFREGAREHRGERGKRGRRGGCDDGHGPRHHRG